MILFFKLQNKGGARMEKIVEKRNKLIGTYLKIFGKLFLIFLVIIIALLIDCLLFSSEKMKGDYYFFIWWSLLFLYLVLFKRQWIREELTSKSRKILTKKEIIIFIILILSIDNLLIFILHFTGQLEWMLKSYEKLFANNTIFDLICVVFYAPILEEFFFRSYVLKELLKVHKTKIAIVMTGLIFGLIHMEPLQVLSAGLSGIFYAYISYKTGNIRMSIYFHFINNLLATIIPIIIHTDYKSSFGFIVDLLITFATFPIYYAGINYINNRGKE